MPGISPIGGNNSGASVLGTEKAQFGDNPFLSLLITQLRHQTPLEPVNNESFMQQMATFSSMEEQKELNANMLQLLDYQGVLARLQSLSEGSTLLGKNVKYATQSGEDREGIVDSIFVDKSGAVRLRVGDDEISMSQITGIERASEKPKPKEPEPKKPEDPKKPDPAKP